jgi:hypothetical protein
MMNQPPDKSLAGARYRGLLLIWGAQVFSLVPFFVVTRVINPVSISEGAQPLLFALGATALATFALSFVVKQKLLARAGAERRPDLVSTGYVIALVLCEMCMFFGLVAHFTTGAHGAFYFIVPAALGFLLHLPRRRHFDDPDANDGAGPDFKSTL